jgi:HEAT repeat protein
MTMSTSTKPDYGVVLKQMNGAIRRLEMYPPGHPSTMQAMEKPFAALQQVFKSEEHFIISRVEDKIVVNGKHLEGADLLKRFLEEFEAHDIDSITLKKSLTKEELNKFLGYFIKPLGKTTQTVSLPDYIRQNQIQSITVDQLRYELVTEDEVVVKSDVVEGADLKVQISKILKDNPQLLRDIFLDKSKTGTGQGTGEGSGQGYGPGCGPASLDGGGEGSGTGSQERVEGVANLEGLKQNVEQHVQNLSDDELISLLASSLALSAKRLQSDDTDTASELNQVVDLVDRLVQDREKDKLLPQIKKILSEHGIVETEFVDYLFDEKWLRTQEVLDELTGMIEKLGSQEVNMDRFMFLWQRVIGSDDGEIKSYAMDKLLFKLDSQNALARSLSVSALEMSLDHFIQNRMEYEFNFLKERLYQRIKDQLLPAGTLKDCSRLLGKVFGELIRQHRFKEAQQILDEYRLRLNPEVAFPEEVKESARAFILDVSSDSTIAELISEMREGVPFHDLKIAEEILEALDGDKVARRLLDVFTLDDRAARMSALRVLSRLGRSSVSAFSDLLSDADNFGEEQEGNLLPDRHWYKIRNVIYVLGNIPETESIKLLNELSSHPDVRVRLEVVKALDKIAQPECAEILLNLLNDEDKEVRGFVITSLASLADESFLNPLQQHLRRRPEDSHAVVAAIGKIGKEKSRDFLLNLLWERDPAIASLAPKTKDEIKMAVLNALGKMESSGLTEQIEKFVKHKRKGLKSLLVKDKVTETANRVLRTMENKSRSSPKAVKEKAEV